MATQTEFNPHVGWLVEGQILLVELEENTQNLLGLYDARVLQYLDASPVPLDIVVVPPVGENKPPSLKQVTSLKFLRHPRLGTLVIIGVEQAPVPRFIMQVMASITGIRVRGVETVEGAVKSLTSFR